jgi:hypothetical protein
VYGLLSRPLTESPRAIPFAPKAALTSSNLTRLSGIQSPAVLEKRLADFVNKLQSYQQESEKEAAGKRQCPGPPGDQPGLVEQDSMSQRPPASRPGSRSPPDGQGITLPPLQVRDDPQAGRQAERQDVETGGSRGYPSIQPSPQHGRMPPAAAPSESWRSAPSRGLGLDAMLNPTEAAGTPASGHRLGSRTPDSSTSARQSHFDPSPTSATYAFPSQQPASNISPTHEISRVGFSRDERTSPRRILTPTTRNPQNRNLSLGRPGAATIDAQTSPFLPSRGRQYTAGSAQLGADTPPASTPQAQTQKHYGFPSTTTTSGHDQPSNTSSMNAPRRKSPSRSASPSMSSVSANQSSSQASPASFLSRGGPPPASGSYFPGQSFAPSSLQAQGSGGLQFQAPSASGTEGPYSAPPPIAPAPPGSSRQTSDPIQVLTITTSQGIYNVPVDVHQASRLADEKRARNAGASARFRQRRKEKEKEASTTIEKMQQQTRDLERKNRDLERERDFYRGERDRFRDVVYRTPELRHLAMQAPPSPLSMRSSSFHGSMGQIEHPPNVLQPPESAERPARRRRTETSGEFSSVAYNLPPTSTLPSVAASGFVTPGPTNLPPLRMESTSTPQTQSNISPATTAAPAPFEPYPQGSYDRRWPGEGGSR